MPSKMDLVNQIIVGALESGKPDCKACGLGIACCGCPTDRAYREKRNQYVNALGEKLVEAAEKVCKHDKKLRQLQRDMGDTQIKYDKAFRKVQEMLAKEGIS